jgi:hypothetical protein
MEKWNEYSDLKPEKGKQIKYINSNNNHGYTYLCRQCGRCTITGGALGIDVIK